MDKENPNYFVEFGEHYVHITERQKHYLEMRSVVDRVLAAAALIVLSPLLLVVSVAQKINAPYEPIFFLQKRVGKDAHCFNIIKFRAMKSTAPKNVATGDLESPEIYISKLGRILRDTSIDELPQLWNVVRGEMSLIGPRPLVFISLMIAIAVLCSWVGALCWNVASQRLPTVILGPLIVFETLAGLLYTFLLRQQMPPLMTLSGIALLVIGVVIAVRAKPEKPLTESVSES